MKRTIILIGLIISIHQLFGQLSLQLNIDSQPADSIFFSNITQDREFQYIPYHHAIDIKLNGALNDMYNLTFYAGENKRMNQLWLNGGRVIIKGSFTGKVLQIDTVVGSDLYYTSLDFRSRFDKLLTQSPDSVAINNFLLGELRQNSDNLFSIEIARNFLMRNMGRKAELKKLFSVLINQRADIRDHLLNPYRKIENILTRNKIELARFQFYTTDGKLEPLVLSKDKRYLIDMWFVGCAPCIEQHKEIAGALTKLNAGNIDVIGISIDQDQAHWKKFLEKKKYGWLNVREIDDPAKKLRTDMLIESYPTYFLVDGEGKIIYRANAFQEVITYLKL